MNIIKKDQALIDKTPWGQLTWFAGAPLGNSDKVTVGECCIDVGCQNPRHQHPNCDEILRVLEGRVIHTLGDAEEEMNVGDTITVPQGLFHNARNIGDIQAVMSIVFTSSVRESVGE